MTCRFPDACRKQPQRPRPEYPLCLPCAQQARREREFGKETLEWCPIHLRADYRRMVKRQHLTAVEARRIIEDHIAVEERRQRRTA